MSRSLLKKKIFRLAQFAILGFFFFFFLNSSLLSSAEDEGLKVANFNFVTTNGESFSTSDLASYKYTVLHFVLPNCGYCKEQLPEINRFANKLQGKDIAFFNIVEGVDSSTNFDSVLKKIKSYAPNMKVVMDDRYNLRELFEIRSYPTLIVLDTQGVIVKMFIGASSFLKHDLDEIFLEK